MDLWWGPAFVLASAAYAAALENIGARGLTVISVVTLWALRLA